MLNYFMFSDTKHRYGWHTCDFCGAIYMTRVRARKHDNCGCTGTATTHGHERGRKVTPELRCYRKMLERCYSPGCRDYGNYGARGIEVCPRWQDSFAAFLVDMGRRPSPKHSIERIDVNGPYSPDNCRWATKLEQARNTRANHCVEIGDIRRTISEWLLLLGLSRTTFYRRLKQGQTPAQALGFLSEPRGGR